MCVFSPGKNDHSKGKTSLPKISPSPQQRAERASWTEVVERWIKRIPVRWCEFSRENSNKDLLYEDERVLAGARKVGFSLILGMLLLIPISGPFVFLTNAKGFNAAGVGAAAGNSLPISDAAYFRSIECHFRIRIHILYSVHFENWPTLSLFFFLCRNKAGKLCFQ